MRENLYTPLLHGFYLCWWQMEKLKGGQLNKIADSDLKVEDFFATIKRLFREHLGGSAQYPFYSSIIAQHEENMTRIFLRNFLSRKYRAFYKSMKVKNKALGDKIFSTSYDGLSTSFIVDVYRLNLIVNEILILAEQAYRVLVFPDQKDKYFTLSCEEYVRLIWEEQREDEPSQPPAKKPRVTTSPSVASTSSGSPPPAAAVDTIFDVLVSAVEFEEEGFTIVTPTLDEKLQKAIQDGTIIEID